MTARLDILDRTESLRNPLLASVLFHAAVLGTFALFAWQFNEAGPQFGSPVPTGGGSVAISPVATIPLPSRQGRRNPVANDTTSTAPQAPPKEVAKRKVKTPDPDAIALKSKEHKPTPQASTQRYQAETPRENQLTSSQAPAAVNEHFAKSGVGKVGVDPYSVLGNRFGAYAALLMQRVADRWRTNGLEGVRGPFAIVSVDIQRNGTIQNPKLVQTSGNYQLDTSAQRAVVEAAPFPPLPPEYEKNVVSVEFRFQVQK